MCLDCHRKIIEEMKVLEKGGSVVIGEEQALGGK
jgi:hypothetical protein